MRFSIHVLLTYFKQQLMFSSSRVNVYERVIVLYGIAYISTIKNSLRAYETLPEMHRTVSRQQTLTLYGWQMWT